MVEKTFAAQLQDFADLTRLDIVDVFQGSVQDVLDVMDTPEAKGGRMPVATGTLRNSQVSGLNGSFDTQGAGAFALTVDGMDIGDTAQFGYTVEYAPRQEFGFVGRDTLGREYNQTGKHFMGSAAALFPQFAAERAARLSDG